MTYLIDTQVFLWFVENSPALPSAIKDLIESDESEIQLSLISIWEISIKTSIGKLRMTRRFEETLDVLNENLIETLTLEFAHIHEVNKLPFHHKDPFDSLIAAQAIVENLDFISADPVFDKYFQNEKVKRIW